MITYSAYDAKAKLSALLDQVEEHGETIIITRHGKPVAKVVPMSDSPWAPVWGPNPALAVVVHEEPTEPTFPDGFPVDSLDPL
ncbi:MAG: type II toxin-antitoxin system Phd/YefM family antitoxin [Myxococcales bacterium]|nr:type II toxin-antitoxin system Phd/YefM family antitoxin [Myxococcales bacterium]